jgi:tripartite-type tricarboxylate transporter receptor subunit TctC
MTKQRTLGMASRLARNVAFALAIFGFATGANADYPDQPIEFVVPFGAGGAFDTLARTLSEAMSEELGVPVVVRNVPGAGGIRGSIELYRSAPDGYTIGFPHYVSIVTDEHLRGNEPQIDWEDFRMIKLVATAEHFIYVPADSPIQSFEDFRDMDPPARFATTGLASSGWTHVFALANEMGIESDWVVGYDSLLDAGVAVVRGDAQAGVGGLHNLSGMMDEIRPIVYFDTQRHPAFPDAPTVVELGYPKYAALASPYIVSAPPGTSDERIAVLETALDKVVQSPAIQNWIEQGGFVAAREDHDPLVMIADQAEIFKALAPFLEEQN